MHLKRGNIKKKLTIFSIFKNLINNQQVYRKAFKMYLSEIWKYAKLENIIRIAITHQHWVNNCCK